MTDKKGKRHFIPLPQSLPPGEGRWNSSPLKGEVREGVKKDRGDLHLRLGLFPLYHWEV